MAEHQPQSPTTDCCNVSAVGEAVLAEEGQQLLLNLALVEQSPVGRPDHVHENGAIRVKVLPMSTATMFCTVFPEILQRRVRAFKRNVVLEQLLCNFVLQIQTRCSFTLVLLGHRTL